MGGVSLDFIEMGAPAAAAALVPLVPTEDVVTALMEHFLGSILSSRSSDARDRYPSITKQQIVAKQMHAVVLLYNYYHRKKYPKLEFLDFESVCQLAVISKPTLFTHLEFMRKRGSKNQEKQLSVTEKAIVEACNISARLDASRDVPNIEEWPVSKIAVFLTDFTKKNCFLLLSSTTQGVWSPIEKTVDHPLNMSEFFSDTNKANIQDTPMKQRLGENLSASESVLQQLAFSAVTETTGIDKKDLMILESHIVYSLSKEQTAAQFYLMKCKESVSEDIIQVSVRDAINSLKGPLVLKHVTPGGSCVVSRVVEHFHLIPYAEILSNWLSREMHQSYLEGSHEGNGSLGSSQTSDNLDHQIGNTRTGTVNLEETGCLDNDNDCRVTRNEVPVSQVKEKMKSSSEYNVGLQSVCKDTAKESGLIVAPDSNGSTGSAGARGMDICIVGTSDQDEIPRRSQSLFLESDPRNFDEVQATHSSKRTRLLLGASRLLQKKRDELSQQERHLQDDIARCEKNLQTISSGNEELNMEIDAILDACNSFSLEGGQGHLGKHPYSGEQHLPKDVKRRKLSEAILKVRSACQDLDDISCKNNWLLPRYNVLPAKGGFQANVWVQGMDFECSVSGEQRDDPGEARESAAVYMLNKLRSMASQVQ